ncbi:MAG TPA: nucleotide exchange factor GrpE [Vicinamibacterales bacterium]|nr:nucleotide exchange factor GrpE [Vicinamibacterales bacterium]
MTPHETPPPDDAPGAPAEGAAAAPPADASAELIAIKADRDDLYDRLLRKTAEFENYRKRVERERQDLRDRAAADLLGDLLPLVDDFERALRVETPSEAEAYRKGVDLIYRQLLDLLEKRGVRPIETTGVTFDPHLHQAVMHEPSPDHPDGAVIQELRRGYMLGNRLLRPALVKVAKA